MNEHVESDFCDAPQKAFAELLFKLGNDLVGNSHAPLLRGIRCVPSAGGTMSVREDGITKTFFWPLEQSPDGVRAFLKEWVELGGVNPEPTVAAIQNTARTQIKKNRPFF